METSSLNKSCLNCPKKMDVFGVKLLKKKLFLSANPGSRSLVTSPRKWFCDKNRLNSKSGNDVQIRAGRQIWQKQIPPDYTIFIGANKLF